MNGVIGLFGTLAILLIAGGLAGLTRRDDFNPRWLLLACLLVALNDALLTRLTVCCPICCRGSGTGRGRGWPWPPHWPSRPCPPLAGGASA